MYYDYIKARRRNVTLLNTPLQIKARLSADCNQLNILPHRIHPMVATQNGNKATVIHINS